MSTKNKKINIETKNKKQRTTQSHNRNKNKDWQFSFAEFHRTFHGKTMETNWKKQQRKKETNLKTLSVFVTSYPGKNKDLPTRNGVAAIRRTFHFSSLKAHNILMRQAVLFLLPRRGNRGTEYCGRRTWDALAERRGKRPWADDRTTDRYGNQGM